MAPGYVIAACFEGAGAIGIVVALRLLHAEQRAKAAELARFLRSGQVPDAPKVKVVAEARPTPALRLGPTARPARAIGPSDALLALRSAYGAAAR
ncbi:hypothetical protein FV226_15645 [Methylobacterium sp. WL12]|uniref:hypothetical protein n=1 Tax=Methylobacterium sp. WL12 TaxID=2603890 RepID=UPI0011C6F5EA|nr:hypothetical protein [Methylobacterium sp. WL12]TXM71277.1 hypothetical protein FV226_15645 [Methylobacterium sp. WL12]